MNITGGVSQSNNNLIIDGSTLRPEAAGSQAAKSVEVKAGSTIQGNVLSVTDTPEGKIANINIGDNVISAKLQDGMGLREGQVLSFTVRSASSGTVTISPLLENTSADHSTLKALAAAGLEVNNDNIQMVKEMMKAQLPINRDAVLDMNKNITSFPNNSIQTMVEMKSLGIPINSNNLVQYESYKNYEHQVTTAMENIMDELPGAFNTLMAEGKEPEAMNLYGNVLKLFGGEAAEGTAAGEGTVISEGMAAAESESGEVAVPLEGKEAAQNISKDGTAGTDETVIKELTVSVNKADNEAAKGKTIIIAEDGLMKEGTGKTSLNGETANVNGKAQLQPDQKTDIPLTEKGASPEGRAQVETSDGKPVSRFFAGNLRNLGIPDDVIKNYTENPKSESAQKELLKSLAQAFDEADLSNPAESASWKKLFSGNDYNRLLRDNISSQWHLKPDDVEKKENIENLYQRLGNQVKGLTEAINQNLGAQTKLGQAANNLQNNLDFMNQLNQMFQYVQLPL